MFLCCCDPSCELVSDDFSDDHLSLWYEQLAGAWTVASGYLSTPDSEALIRFKATNDQETATTILFARIRAMTAGDVLKLCLGMTADGSDYLYARITDTGECGEVVLGGVSAGVLSRVIHLGKTSDGASYLPLFVAYDETGWLHFGTYGAGTPNNATTVAAVQVAAPGIYAGVATGAIDPAGVRFDYLAFDNYSFPVDYTGTSGGCFTHTVPCAQGGGSACYPNQPACTFPWHDFSYGVPCPVLTISGDFWLQASGVGTEFGGAYRSAGDGKLVNGIPVLYGGNELSARASFWVQDGGTSSAKIRVYVDCDATGAGGAYAEVNVIPGDFSTVQLFSAGGTDLTGPVNITGVAPTLAGTVFGIGVTVTVQRDGNLLRASVRPTDLIEETVIAAANTGWANAGYVAVETVDVVGNVAITPPGISASLDDPHPTLRPGDTPCHSIGAVDCRTCATDGSTIRAITVSLGGALAGYVETCSPPAPAFASPPDDDGCCADITGTYALGVNDWIGGCQWRRTFPWCYGTWPSFGGIVATASAATVTITVELTSTKVKLDVRIQVSGTVDGSPVGAVSVYRYEATPGGNPSQTCDNQFGLTYSSASGFDTTFTGCQRYLCSGFASLFPTVEISK